VELEVNIDDAVFSMMLAPVAEFDYVNIYARDITKVRRVEEESKQRQNELVHVSRLSTMGEMATGIAHELNQPLSTIVNSANGCARRLRLDIGGKDDLLNALEQISVQARRAAEIIKRLRGMVSRQAPVRQFVDLNALILEVCSLMTHDIRRQQVAIERSLSSTPLMVRVDPVQIEQALLNLIRNALDSLTALIPLERRLTLSSGRRSGGLIYVSVKDNGAGIEAKEMEHLFDAFYTTKQTGMGMGLAITQTIVEDHHGRIHADSWPGKGSTFTIELPASTESSESVTI